MKNETARREIESLDYYLQNHTDDYSEESHTAMMMAVKALDQEPCEDAISRQAVLDGLASIAKAKAKSDAQKSLMGRVMFFTEQLPPVNPQEPKTETWSIKDVADTFKKHGLIREQEPKTGHWEWVQYDYNPKLGNWNCSECRSVVIECVGKEEKGGIPLYKYCPQCGAKMQESED